MKREIISTVACLGLFGVLQAPAVAKEVVWFQSYDTNGDGSWSYPEFVAANEHYYTVHPKEVRITTKELRHQFDDLDVDHDGLVRVDEVKTYHNWE
jgi:Ca2+-binding EF-hand superfamily protein